MTREYRITVLKTALRQSKDGQLYVVLLDKDTAMIVQGEKQAANLVQLFGYRVYAKCKDGYMIL
jgi:hypothetical protein